tara:strand:- start:2282 stop:2539 length:258 start_codon:yes stop_codon:yes gene_type:complete
MRFAATADSEITDLNQIDVKVSSSEQDRSHHNRGPAAKKAIRETAVGFIKSNNNQLKEKLSNHQRSKFDCTNNYSAVQQNVGRND